jgi:hypothetical protein
LSGGLLISPENRRKMTVDDHFLMREQITGVNGKLGLP